MRLIVESRQYSLLLEYSDGGSSVCDSYINLVLIGIEVNMYCACGVGVHQVMRRAYIILVLRYVLNPSSKSHNQPCIPRSAMHT